MIGHGSVPNSQLSANQASIALLTFRVADQACSLPIHSIIRIIEMVALTPLPGAPESIVGVINVHGKVVPVMDARLRFGLPPRAYGLYTPIILLEISRDKQMLSLVVDSVEQVVEVLPHQLASTQIIMPAEMIEPIKTQAAYLDGIATVEHQLILALSVGNLLSLTEQQLLTQVLIQRADPEAKRDELVNEP